MSTPTPVALDHDPFLRELLARTQRTKDAAALRFLAVNDTHLMVRYGQAALWFKAEGVVALSGSIEPDRNGPSGLGGNSSSAMPGKLASPELAG